MLKVYSDMFCFCWFRLSRVSFYNTQLILVFLRFHKRHRFLCMGNIATFFLAALGVFYTTQSVNFAFCWGFYKKHMFCAWITATFFIFNWHWLLWGSFIPTSLLIVVVLLRFFIKVTCFLCMGNISYLCLDLVLATLSVFLLYLAN